MTITGILPPAGGPLGRDALVTLYPRNPDPTVRVNFVAALDGAATVDGKSGALGGPGDKQIFDVLRMLCDVLVVAAGTVRNENYDALRLDAEGRDWRRAHGLAEFPLMAVVSGSLDLDLDQLVFADAPVRPVVITHERADADRRAAVAGVADVVATGDGEVDLGRALAELRGRGAGQVLCEGGPRLFGAMVAADLVDELCLTMSPLLTGGAAGRIAVGPAGPGRPMTLRHVLAEDDMLFLRYARRT